MHISIVFIKILFIHEMFLLLYIYVDMYYTNVSARFLDLLKKPGLSFMPCKYIISCSYPHFDSSRGVSGYVAGCPSGVWGLGLTTSPYVGSIIDKSDLTKFVWKNAKRFWFSKYKLVITIDMINISVRFTFIVSLKCR